MHDHQDKNPILRPGDQRTTTTRATIIGTPAPN